MLRAIEELPSAPGTTKVLCDLWVTRDVCSREAGEWPFHSSEAIGNENWPAGTRPPVRTW